MPAHTTQGSLHVERKNCGVGLSARNALPRTCNVQYMHMYSYATRTRASSRLATLPSFTRPEALRKSPAVMSSRVTLTAAPMIPSQLDEDSDSDDEQVGNPKSESNGRSAGMRCPAAI